ATAKVGATDKRGPTAGYIIAAGHPLNTELGRFVGADFDDQAFNQHLGAALIQLVYDFTQTTVEWWRGLDDKRIGSRIGLDGGTASAESFGLHGVTRAAQAAR